MLEFTSMLPELYTAEAIDSLSTTMSLRLLSMHLEACQGSCELVFCACTLFFKDDDLYACYQSYAAQAAWQRCGECMLTPAMTCIRCDAAG